MTRIAALGLTLTLAATPALAGDHGWSRASDVGVAALMAAAFGTSAAKQDWEGGKEAAVSIGATALEAYGLKEAFPEERPNGRNNKSFPSGHTAVSFAAAGYLQERYGWQVGLPATAAAAFVGLARVQGHQHHWYDAVAGAAVGEATALLITHPLNDNVRILPWADTRGGGLALAARF